MSTDIEIWKKSILPVIMEPGLLSRPLCAITKLKKILNNYFQTLDSSHCRAYNMEKMETNVNITTGLVLHEETF